MALLYKLLDIPFFENALYGYLEANAWLANAILLGWASRPMSRKS